MTTCAYRVGPFEVMQFGSRVDTLCDMGRPEAARLASTEERRVRGDAVGGEEMRRDLIQ